MKNKEALRRQKGWRIGGGVLALVLLVLWWIGVLGGNVREVDPHRFYRSAQLSHGTLTAVLDRYHIRSVVNLRGANPGMDAYDSEVAICRARGLAHRDFSLSAQRFPPPQELTGIVSALDRLPRPILVHCRAGSDRTGLVSALYVHLEEGAPLDDAERRQLTWRYGHFSFGSAGAMDRFFDLYRQTSQGKDMRTWIRDLYSKIYDRLRKKGAPDVDPPSGRE